MEGPISRARWLQETRRMRFQEAYAGWQEKRLTQEDAGQLLGVSGRTFRRQIGRFEAEGMQGLVDLRMSQGSSRRAPGGGGGGGLLGVSGRSFGRKIGRFEAGGMQGLVDLRMSQVSSRRAPVDEVLG